jgi:single-strand DNA-binding protein
VLQGFNGQLTMLDGRQRDGAGDADQGGGDFGRSGPFTGGGKGGGKGASFDKELDDEIPF